MEFIGSLIALSIYAGGVFVLNETMTTGQFMSFLVSLLLAYQPVKALGNLNISVQEGLAGAESFKLLDTSEEKMEKVSDKNNITLNGDIILKNISFGYGEKNVLENINLKFLKEKSCACRTIRFSKSTIANIIARFFDNYNGDITIDDQNIKKMHLTDLRNNISMVTQETVLFNDTIANNIKYGKLEANNDEIKKVAKLAGIKEFSDLLEKN